MHKLNILHDIMHKYLLDTWVWCENRSASHGFLGRNTHCTEIYLQQWCKNARCLSSFDQNSSTLHAYPSDQHHHIATTHILHVHSKCSYITHSWLQCYNLHWSRKHLLNLKLHQTKCLVSLFLPVLWSKLVSTQHQTTFKSVKFLVI